MSASRKKEPVEIPQPLDDIRAYVDTVVYAPDEEKDTMALVWAVTHKIDPYNTLPRVLITSTEPEGGKTTWLNLSTYLALNGWMTDPTPFAIRSKIMQPDGVTPITDEISKIFGESGLRGQGNPIYKLLVESYQRNATISFSVDRTPQEVSSFCVAIMAGLKTAAPKDLRSRSIRIVMRPAPEAVELEDSLDPGIESLGRQHAKRLHAWMNSFDTDEIANLARNYRHYHRKLRSRKAQIWTPLFVVAELAGGDWPDRIRRAFVKLALDSSEKPVLSPDQQVLIDAANFIGTSDASHLTSAELLTHLRSIKDNDIYRTLSDRQMAMLMTQALGNASVLTLANPRRKVKGWRAMPILKMADELEAMLNPPEDEDYEDEFDSFFETTEVTETTELAAG